MNPAQFLTVIPVLLCLFTAVAPAGTIPGSMPRETLTYSRSLDRFSVNTGFEFIRRKVDLDGLGTMTLEAESPYLLIGFDVLDWLTVFGTMGACEAEVRNNGVNLAEFDDPSLKWSLGANANLWRYDVNDPRFIAGRLSLRAVAELARYSADGTGCDIYWDEFALSFPVGYEMLADYGPHQPENVFSLAMYLGPGVSMVDGSADISVGDVGFDGKESLALVAGVDLYLSHNFSIGIHGQYADEGRVAGVVQYHF